MGETTKIEWCDHTASPWYGCAHVHAGCDHCFAEAMAKRNPATLGTWGEGGARVQSKSFAANCRKWNKQANEHGVIESVFPSLCDPFEDHPALVPWRKEMFDVIDECQNPSGRKTFGGCGKPDGIPANPIVGMCGWEHLSAIRRLRTRWSPNC